MWNIDRLQLLRRDKCRFNMRLLNKYLRILAKERKEELLNSRCYLDMNDNQELLLVIDQNLPQNILLDLSKKQSDPMISSSGRLDEDMQEDENEEEEEIGDEQPSAQRNSLDSIPRQMASDEQHQQQQSERNSLDPPKKKKKRMGLSFNSGSRRSNSSKNMQSLPSFLADFSWLENTEANCQLLAEERNRILEAKRQKEFERMSK